MKEQSKNDILVKHIHKKHLKFTYKQKNRAKKKNWQLPIFAYTIVGVKVLNFCVRDGNRCIHFAIVTNLLFRENNSLKT